jgi:hypothetical protein
MAKKKKRKSLFEKIRTGRKKLGQKRKTKRGTTGIITGGILRRSEVPPERRTKKKANK